MFLLTACTVDLPQNDTETSVSVTEEGASRPAEESKEDSLSDALVSPDGKSSIKLDENGDVTYCRDDGTVAVAKKGAYPENATVTACAWIETRAYITFTSDKDTVVCWDGEADPIYIKEGDANSFSPLSATEYGTLIAGEYEMIPYHDGSMDTPTKKRTDIFGYLVFNTVETDNVLTVTENADILYVVPFENCTLTVKDCETGEALSDRTEIAKNDTLLIKCLVPEGMPAHTLYFEGENVTAEYILYFDGRGETELHFILKDR